MQPVVSVIIPTFRRPLRLAEALKSVAAQTYPALEVIVVNDGGVPIADSIDQFRATTDITVTLIDLPENRGGAAARNAGAGAAQGDYLALLDDDDRFRPEHIARLVAALAAEPAVVLAYDDALILLEDTAEGDAQRHITATCRFGRPYDKASFDVDDYIVTSTCLIRRADFAALGGFDETLRFCEDWDLLLRLRERGALRYVPGAIGVDYSMRVAAGDNTGSVFDADRRAALDYLSQRYGLPPLVPKTFLDVARDLGFTIEPVSPSA